MTNCQRKYCCNETLEQQSQQDLFKNYCRTFTLFSKSLPLDIASRVWDVFCRDGEEFLFRAALGEFLTDDLICVEFLESYI